MYRVSLAAAVLLAGLGIGAAHAQPAARSLVAGTPVADTIQGADVHAFTFPLAAGSMVAIDVMQNGVDVVLTLRAPDGGVVAEMDSPNGSNGPEKLHALVETAGTYRLEVRRLAESSNPASGRYEARLIESRPATEAEKQAQRDQKSIAALEEQWETALERHDLAAVDRLLDGAFAYFSPVGASDKPTQMTAWAEQFKANVNAKEVHDITGRTTRLFGDTGVTMGRALITITNDGRTNRIPGRFVHVWQRRGDTWRMVVDHFYADGSVPEDRKETPIDSATLTRIAGTYESVDGTKVTLAGEEGGLLMRPADTNEPWRLAFVAESASEFFAKEGDFQLAFLAGATAAADRVLFINAGRVLRLKRVVP